jgi:hypothetical protein
MTRIGSAFLFLFFLLAAPRVHAEFLDCIFSAGGFENQGTTDPEALAGLNLINCARKTVEPPADPSLSMLTWSVPAATVAQTVANGCRYQHSGVPGFGESINHALAGDPPSTIRDAVAVWMGEQPYYNYADNTCTEPAEPDGTGTCNDYTQAVWSTTTQVGCAITLCTQHSPYAGNVPWYFTVCEYLPTGNTGGKPY